MDATMASRDFERKNMREVAGKALAELKAKGMQVNELPASESARMRVKLAQVNAGIAAGVGQELRNQTQAAPAALRNQARPDQAKRMNPR
jgi:TRAP-type C4-dicarboxylate transport system substrate-binding protein